MTKQLLATTALATLVLSIAIASTTAPASADTRNIGRSGNWTAYAGQADNGQDICGMTVDSRSGKSFHVKILRGDSALRIIAWKKGWNIPEGTKLTVSLGFDTFTLGDATASGYRSPPKYRAALGDYIQFWVGLDMMEEFFSGFQDSKQMWLRFTSGSESDWLIDMNGSRQIGATFAACAKNLLATQPYGKQPETSGTQPFGNDGGTQPFGSEGFEPDRPKPQPAAPQRAPHWNPV